MNSAVPKAPAPTPPTDVSARLASSLTAQPATICTTEGRYITGGLADFEGAPLNWTATLSHLDQPGQIATLFFAEGIRDVIVRLEDGRRARARITSTSVRAGAERVCFVEGIERLV